MADETQASVALTETRPGERQSAGNPPSAKWVFTVPGIATVSRAVFVVLALVAFAYVARVVVVPVLLAWVVRWR